VCLRPFPIDTQIRPQNCVLISSAQRLIIQNRSRVGSDNVSIITTVVTGRSASRIKRPQTIRREESLPGSDFPDGPCDAFYYILLYVLLEWNPSDARRHEDVFRTSAECPNRPTDRARIWGQMYVCMRFWKKISPDL